MLVKFADDMTVSAPVKTTGDTAFNEVKNISDWAKENRMILNFSKTWEIVISKGSLKQLPPPIDGIRRKKWMKLLGVKFQDDPCCWDLHVDELLSKASGRMYILRVCKSYGYAGDQLTKLFETLILSLFTYAIEVWGSALLKKYLKQIDQFFRRARRYGYTTKEYEMSSLIEEKDRALFRKITKDTEHVLHDLLPEMKHRTLRTENHNYILPQIKTERFKRCFVNRCLYIKLDIVQYIFEFNYACTIVNINIFLLFIQFFISLCYVSQISNSRIITKNVHSKFLFKIYD